MKAFLEGMSILELRRITCQPIPARWEAFHTRRDLAWSTYRFAPEVASEIPEAPGFYCFFVGPPLSGLPPVGYPLYLGKTERTLQVRYREYLREQNHEGGRYHVRKFLNVFEGELAFICTTFEGTHDQVVTMEGTLLDAVMPAYSDNGYGAAVRAGRAAWQ